MVGVLAHRGPDETVVRVDGPVGFGFTRLSLVDPENGGQPLVSADGSVMLIANGEIYNHVELARKTGARLRGGSDCEILLHLYQTRGLHFLDEVRGMFALVLWDNARRQLVVARDRFGIKPIFTHINDERILFASEIKALFADPRTSRAVDWVRALADPIVTGSARFEDSPPVEFFADIDLVPAATIRTFGLDDRSVRDHVYWSFPEAGTSDASEAELVTSYRDLLASSVAECGMADVEIGLLLSGGLDSAAVAALARPTPKTFTVVGAGTLLNGDAEGAHRTAAALGIENHQVIIPASFVPSPDAWLRHLWLQETPLAGPESYFKSEAYRWVGRNAPSIKAMLLGGGADEFNGGYISSFGYEDWASTMPVLQGLSLAASSGTGALGGWWSRPDSFLVNDDVIREATGAARDPYEHYLRWKYREVQNYNCWHEDRSAAGSGIEARVPFLDHRLVELSVGVAPERRQALLWDKRILRRAMVGVLPEEILERPKAPFFYGPGTERTYAMFARMLTADGGALVERARATHGARRFLNRDAIRAQTRQLADGAGLGRLEYLLRLVNLALLESLSTSPPPALESLEPLPLPASLEVTNWAAEQASIEETVLDRSVPRPDDVLSMPPGTFLVEDEAGSVLVVVDGSIEFVLDDQPAWLNFIRAVNGRRNVKDLLEDAGVALIDIEGPLLQALDAQVLRVAA
jgi:asparagine synthase (glutamine-hydrolysing)